MNPAPTRRRLEDLDPDLGPVLTSRRTDDVVPAAQAVMTRAYALGITASSARTWLKARGDDRFAYVTSTPQAWWKHVARPTERFIAYSVAGGAENVRRRRSVARALTAHLLAPIPFEEPNLTAAKQVTARRVLAAIGCDILVSLGSETPMLNARVNVKDLAVTLGISEGTCASAIRTCLEAGWLKRVGEPRRGGANRYRIRELTPTLDEFAWRHATAIDALAMCVDDPLGEIVQAAGHPALGYHPTAKGSAPAKAWLYALADVAEVQPTDLGLSPGFVSSARRLWQGLLSADVDATLAEDLDASARVSGAIDRYANARAKRAKQAAARTAEVQAVRERRVKIRSVVERLLTEHPVPKPEAPVVERDSFVAALRGRLVAQPPPDEWRRDLAKILASRLVRRGYEEATADRVSAYVAGLDVTEAGAA